MAYYRLMGDVHFSCPACTQPLVAEEAAAGLSIACPHCGKSLQIPRQLRDEKELEASRKLAKWINRATELERELYDAHTQLAGARHESEERQTALVEATQLQRNAKEDAELWEMEAKDLRVSCETMTVQLRNSQTAAIKAQRRVVDLEADCDRLEQHVQQVEVELSHKKQQVEAGHAERNELLKECAQKSASLSEMGAELDAVRGELNEKMLLVNRTRHELSRAEALLAEAQAENEKISSDLIEAGSDARHLRATLKLAQQQRDELAEAIKQDHELSDFLALKETRNRFEIDLRDAQITLAEVREKLAAAAEERDELRRETVELRLQVSALRESASDSGLVHDNKMLRGIIDRLNEELKDRPAPRVRRGHHDRPLSRRVGDLARALWARCFVSDPDIV